MPNQENLFQSAEQFNPEDFPKHIVVRWIIAKLGKNDKQTLVLLHERPDWSKLEPLKYQLYGGSLKVGETAEVAVRRELREELKINDKNRSLLGAGVTGDWLNYYFSLTRKIARPIRDKSGQTHVYGDLKDQPIRNDWFSLTEINSGKIEVAFNHTEVINAAIENLRTRRNA